MNQDQAMKDAFAHAKAPTIVRSVGDRNRVVANGKEFTRQKSIIIPGMENKNIQCAPYDNHFIFRDTRSLGWTLFCSCGAPAVVVGYNAYRKDASKNQGELLVCYAHAQTNRHADGST